MERIRCGLKLREAFIVLSEMDSTGREGFNLSDVLKICMWVIIPGTICEVNDGASERIAVEVAGISYARISRKDIPEVTGMSELS